MNEILLTKNISKSFPGVIALNKVNISVREGEVLGLLGENGAGKSTLMKVLSGVYKPDEGEIYINGRNVTINDTKHSQELGISIVYQELNLIPTLTVAENIFLGRFPLNKFRKINYKKLITQTGKFLDRFNFNLDPEASIRELTVGKRQMVEIAKAISFNSRVILMDEPTSSLTNEETEKLFKIIDALKAKGVGIVFITHKLEEIFRICARVKILRDGQDVGEEIVSGTSEEKLIKLMVGREIGSRFPKKTNTLGEDVLEVKNLSRGNDIKNISFSVKRGEVFGIAGLVGSGRSEVIRTIYGADRMDSGEVYVNGKKVDIKTPKDAINYGIFLVPEDRKLQGLILGFTIEKNISIAILNSLRRFLGYVDGNKEEDTANSFIKMLSVKTTGKDQVVNTLSGGNQQKVVLSKCLATNPQILILDDPTRGIDVGTKAEIYSLINKLTEDGKSVILISSELPEVISMSDRVGVMYKGELRSILNKSELTQENIMALAIGGVRL